MFSRVLLIFSIALTEISRGEEPSEALAYERRRQTLSQTLDAIADMRKTRRGTPEEKANAAKAISKIHNWKEELHPYLMSLVRRSQEGFDQEQGRIELRRLMEGLATAPSDLSVQLIGPILEANGKLIGHLDTVSTPSQTLAVQHLRDMQIGGFPLKGAPPGAKEAIAFKDALERNRRGENVVIPDIRGSLDDWRRWWSSVKAEYESNWELPADLQAPALPLPGEGRRLTLLQTLDAIAALPTTRRGTPEEKANAAKSVSRIPNWKELLYPYVTRLVGQAERAQFPDKGDKGAARSELRGLMEGLAAAPSDEAVRLIAPILEANGRDLFHGDAYDPSSQSLALESLRSMQVSGFVFKGTPPGAKEVIAFNAAVERSNRGESVVLPKVPGKLDDWRWWRSVKAEYNSDFELPADLRALALPAPQK